jgi:diguanylate cyclase (GGDEF)-like protein
MDKEEAAEKTPEQLIGEIGQLKKRISQLESAPKARINDLDYFNERLAEEAARSTRYKYEFSILLVRIDNFEAFSEKCGEGAEAEIVSMMDVVLKNTLRTTDLKCTFGTAQYGILLPYTDSGGGRIAAEKLRQAVERIFMLKGRTANIRLTLSGGIANYPKNAVSPEQLMALAKEALASARTEGGNCVCLAEELAGAADLEKVIRSRLLHNDTFIKALDDEVSRCSRYGQKFSLLLIAITCFETKGMSVDGSLKAGIMREAFKILNARVRTIDKTYLYTDSRFAVIVPHTGHEGAAALAEKLMHSLTANPVARHDEADISISMNTGVAAFPNDAVSSEGLLRRTEAALSQAIKNGVNKTEFASNVVAGSGQYGRDVNDLIARLREAGPSAVYNLLAAVDVTEHYERPHSQMVAKYSMAIGLMLGLPSVTVRRLRVMALLHDLGKACLPDTVITKPGPLVDMEWDAMMKHPQYCSEMLKEFTDFEFCCLPVLAHHERPDGKGYPRGLKGEQVPLESRIIAVAEAYDDMVTPRPYRQQVSSIEALEELKNQAGSQFDTAVVKAFIKALPSIEAKVQATIP